MPGPYSHPIFVQKLRTPRKGITGRFRDVLSIGGSSYYIKSEGIETRTYIYNYFNLLEDAKYRSKWEVNFYSSNGKLAKKVKGVFEGAENVIVDSKDIKELDDFGVIHTKIRMDEGSDMFVQPYTTTFFNEYYRPDSPKHGIFAHSLGAPAAIHYSYYRYSSGWSIKTGFRPYLLIASGCKFHRIGHRACAHAKINFINFNKEVLSLEVKKLKTMECRRLDLFELCRPLKEHLADRPFSIVIDGENILSKPYFYQSDGKFLLGEHL